MSDESSPAPASLAGEWSALGDALSTLSRVAAAAEKAVRAVDAERDPPGAAAALQHVDKLRPALAAEPLQTAAVEALAPRLAEAVADWRLTRLGAFREAAEAANLPFQRLTTDELRLGEATVRLDLDRGEAEILYARESLETLRAEPRAVVDAVRRHLAALRRDDPPESVFHELVQAYRVLCAQLLLPLGERVNLVDLVAPLFYVRQSETFWKKQDAKALRPVSRAQLAWDLDHLQQARCLEVDGLRLALGTATGGSTAKKSNVLFLESAAAGGQYFLTFAVRRADAPPA